MVLCDFDQRYPSGDVSASYDGKHVRDLLSFKPLAQASSTSCGSTVNEHKLPPRHRYRSYCSPAGEAVSELVPSFFRLSPVPWRKLYSRKFMQKNKLAFSEGDFFFEDEELHWKTFFHASRVRSRLECAPNQRSIMCLELAAFVLFGQVGFVDKVLVHHRKDRGGDQTTDSSGDATVRVCTSVQDVN